jgi:hypothetical protein
MTRCFPDEPSKLSQRYGRRSKSGQLGNYSARFGPADKKSLAIERGQRFFRLLA